MLDIRAFVHAKEAQSLFVADPVAVDQPFDLGARNRGELAFLGVQGAEA